jgi:hypothetical protein
VFFSRVHWENLIGGALLCVNGWTYLVKICGRWEGFTLRTTFTGEGFTLRTTFTGEGFTLRTTFTGEG